MAVQTDKLKRMFDSDSKLMLESLSQLVSEMSAGDVDPEKIDRAFRAAHSIKSEAGFLELNGVADAAHTLEESLAALRSGESGGASGRLEGDLSELARVIGEYHAHKPKGEDAVAPDLPATEALGPAERGMLREARGRNEKLFRVAVKLTCDPEFYYPRGFLAVNNLELQCGVVQTSPAIEALKNGDGSLSLLLTTGGDEALLRRLLTVDDVEITEVTELAYTEVEQALTEVVREPRAASGRRISVDARAHDELMLLVDELGHLTADLSKLVGQAGTTADELKGVSRQLSVLGSVLKSRVDRSARVQLLDAVRDLRERSVAHAARAGKRLRFVVSGGGAVVFSAVADTLTDAILHLVRNSIDHGIDTIQERATNGKPPAGTIGISVDRAGESIRIRVTDDGKGIDESAVRRQFGGDPARSLLEILSAPGFTMRAEPTRSSGRGVGLDTVVHTVRDLLSGSIELTSAPGSGTTVDITIPAASSLMDVLILDTLNGPVAIPSALVVDHQPLNLRRFKRDSLGARYYDYRGRSLPLLTVFGRNPDDDAFAGTPIGVVVRCGARHAVLLATRVAGSEAVVRDGMRRRSVYSRTVGKEVPFVFPSICLTR